MEKDSLVSDLSSPVSTSEKDKGLQITLSLPTSIEKHLSHEAAENLQEIGQRYLHGILLEAQRLAGSDSQHLGIEISGRDVSRAEGIERKRLQAKRDKWAYLRDISLAGLGAGFGNVLTPWLALALVSVFGALFILSNSRT